MRRTTNTIVASITMLLFIACMRDGAVPQTVQVPTVAIQPGESHEICVAAEPTTGQVVERGLFESPVVTVDGALEYDYTTGNLYDYDPLDDVYPIVGVVHNTSDFAYRPGHLHFSGNMLCDFQDRPFEPSILHPVHRIGESFVGIHRADDGDNTTILVASGDGETWEPTSIDSVYPILIFVEGGIYQALAGTELWDISDVANPELVRTIEEPLFPPMEGFQQPWYAPRVAGVYRAYQVDDQVFAWMNIHERGLLMTVYIVNTNDLSVEPVTGSVRQIPSGSWPRVERSGDGVTLLLYDVYSDPGSGSIFEINPNGQKGVEVRRLRE